jgi:hypothetical protein
VTDRVIRAVLTGSSAGAVKAFEETALAAESSARKVSGTTTEHASKAEGAFSSISGKLMNVGMGLAVGGLALGAVGDLVAKTMGEEQAAMAKLNTAMSDAGQKWTPALKDQFDKTRGSMTGLGFEGAQSADAIAKFVTAGVPATDAMKDMSTAADLARFKNISLGDATDTLTKASMGSVKALKDLGITSGPVVTKAKDLEAAQTTLAKAQDNLNTLQTSGHATHAQLAKAQDAVAAAQGNLTKKQGDYNQTAKHMNEIVGLAEPKIKGQAEAYSKTLPGALSVIKASLTDKLLVPLGEKVMPLFERLANWVSEHSSQISAVLGGAVIALGIAFDVLGKAMDVVNGIISWIVDHWHALMPLFAAILGGLIPVGIYFLLLGLDMLIAAADAVITAVALWLPLAPILLVGAAIGVLAYLFIAHFGEIKDIVLLVIHTISDVIMTGIHFITDHWQVFALALVTILTGGLGLLVYLVATHIGDIVGFFEDLPGRVLGALQGLGGALGKFFSGLPGSISGGLSQLGGFLIAGFKNAIDYAIINPLNTALDSIGALGGSIGPLSFHVRDAFGGGMPHIPALQFGGIITKPTLAMIAEAGRPEAVVPLDRLGPMGLGGGMTNVVINVYGGDPQAVVNALQQYMRSNGSVPITVRAASRLGAA